MGSSALQIATLLALATFLRSDTVTPLHLVRVAFSVTKLFLDPVVTVHYTLLIKFVRAEKTHRENPR